MSFCRIPEHTEEYALLGFDKDGNERRDDPAGRDGLLSKELLARITRDQPSHVFLFSHGWKGDVDSAKDQYNRWIKAMLDRADDRQAVKGTFTPMWIGLHWPSLPFGDEEFGAGDAFDADSDALAPEAIVAIYRERLGLGEEAEPLLNTIVQAHQRDAAASALPADAKQAYLALAKMAGHRAEGPSGPPDADGTPFNPEATFDAGNATAADFGGGGGLLEGVLSPLRQLSYWTMKKRARTIGEGGMHRFMTDLMNAAPKTRIHLMGHSFGCIVMSSVVGGPGAGHPLPRQVDSLALIQGAVSLWAFGEKVLQQARKGYFNPWVHRGAIRGPVIVSRSIHDKAVGTLYPWASAVSFSDGSFEPESDDDLPLYGAIGRFGIRGLPGATFTSMLDANGSYGFEAGKLYNLEASKFIAKGGGVSGAHSDIDGPQVAHALWQAALV
jgi:hypothetical protein